MMAIHSYVELQRTPLVEDSPHLYAAQTPLGGPGPSDWDFAIKVATQHEPKCISYAPYLATYVRCYGGGYGAPLILDLNEYSSRFAAGCILGGDFLNNVLQMKFQQPCPLIVTSCLKTQLTCPAGNISLTSGLCKLLDKGALNKIANYPKVMEVPN